MMKLCFISLDFVKIIHVRSETNHFFYRDKWVSNTSIIRNARNNAVKSKTDFGMFQSNVGLFLLHYTIQYYALSIQSLSRSDLQPSSFTHMPLYKSRNCVGGTYRFDSRVKFILDCFTFVLCIYILYTQFDKHC